MGSSSNPAASRLCSVRQILRRPDIFSVENKKSWKTDSSVIVALEKLRFLRWIWEIPINVRETVQQFTYR
ncbi:hypothetical protein GAYE_SCF06G2697 [Galdieria yellowstonensis]|uniref:Uncharacterized protein n=1 Tax=Galdieria yellowstonensis TaxID=3028027 RepID=A0AAV9I331_9RHOD|nr:hypothetical protein GAYE_HTGSCF06PCTG21G0285 [Galdieria yellowstonensis]KAK4524794.1 hypothetical protein GAYE_SCF06G2697 [Galdieria yellowstonensis]